MKYVILDIETSGLVPKGADYKQDFMVFPYILSMAWKINDQPTYEYIINQENKPVPPEATAINGITDAMCQASKFNTFSTILQFMMDSADADFIIGYNLYFDTSIIKANFLRIIEVNKKTPMIAFDKLTDILHKDKRIDIMRACAKLFGGKWPTLSEAYTRLFQEQFNAHSAGEDVDATYRIFQELIRLNAIKIALPEKVVAEVAQKIIAEEEI